MPLDLATLVSLAAVCAPAVAPRTLLAVAQVESGFNPLAIGVNGPSPRHLSFADPVSAARAARTLLARGRNIDLGLGQINARNLAPLGLSVEAAFDPCRNMKASATVLATGYRRAAPAQGAEQSGLRTALSYYNTGHPLRGLANGYVEKVTAAAGRLVPALEPDSAAPVAAPAAPAPAPWDVFPHAGRQLETSFVIVPESGALQ